MCVMIPYNASGRLIILGMLIAFAFPMKLQAITLSTDYVLDIAVADELYVSGSGDTRLIHEPKGTTFLNPGTIVFGDSKTIIKRRLFVDSFEIEFEGWYQASLNTRDVTPFDNLGMIISSPTKVMGSIFDEGSFIFQATPGSYYATSYAKYYNWSSDNTAGVLDVLVRRLSDDEVPVSPTPLPAPLFLLAAALIAMVCGAIRRNRLS